MLVLALYLVRIFLLIVVRDYYY